MFASSFSHRLTCGHIMKGVLDHYAKHYFRQPTRPLRHSPFSACAGTSRFKILNLKFVLGRRWLILVMNHLSFSRAILLLTTVERNNYKLWVALQWSSSDDQTERRIRWNHLVRSKASLYLENYLYKLLLLGIYQDGRLQKLKRDINIFQLRPCRKFHDRSNTSTMHCNFSG